MYRVYVYKYIQVIMAVLYRTYGYGVLWQRGFGFVWHTSFTLYESLVNYTYEDNWCILTQGSKNRAHPSLTAIRYFFRVRRNLKQFSGYFRGGSGISHFIVAINLTVAMTTEIALDFCTRKRYDKGSVKTFLAAMF